MISADGRYVAFESRASNLIAEDLNSGHDVFVRDLASGVTSLVSVNTNGGSANRSSELLTITPDARFIAFWSDATDILSEATSTTGEVYVRDTQAGVTYCLTETIQIFGPRRFKTVLTPDGRYAALQKLELGDPWFSGPAPVGSSGHVFRADVLNGSVSQLHDLGRPGRGLAINDEGSRLMFYGVGGSPFVTNGLYLRDMSIGANHLVIKVATDVGSFQVSSDFQNLFFTMSLTNHGFQLFKHRLVSGETVLLSTNAVGQPIRSEVSSPFSIDSTATTVAFATAADDLASNDFNRASDVFILGSGLAAPRHPDLLEGTGFGVATLNRNGVTADGTRVIYSSADSSLVARDTNKNFDVFVSDLKSGNVLNPDGVIRSNTVMATMITADGSAVLIQRLLGTEFQGRLELYRTDLRTGDIQRIQPGFFRTTDEPLMSQDGRWVVLSDARVLITDFRTPVVPGQASNQVVDLRYDGSREGNGTSSNATISLDGEWVAFASRATDLVNPGEDGGAGTLYPSGVPQVFARSLRRQRTRLVSITDSGAPLPSGAVHPVLSANARYVLFQTFSGSNVYRHDLLATGQVTNVLVCSGCSQPSISGDGEAIAYLSEGQVYISLAGGGVETFPGVSDVTEVALSIDGRFVAWAARASGISQIYLHDRWNATSHLLSRNYLDTSGGNSHSARPVFSHEGRTIAFQSFASDLVAGDYNGRRDIFVVQILQVDTDSDGMDDDWETRYFQNLARDGSGNVDGDHLNDRDEFLAGTNPLDLTSALRFTGISSRVVPGPMQDTELKWTSASGKTYRVQHRPTLATPWSDLTGDIMTGGPNGSATHLDPAHQTGFYRLLLAP
jgi:Tol biopolymer transport system component